MLTYLYPHNYQLHGLQSLLAVINAMREEVNSSVPSARFRAIHSIQQSRWLFAAESHDYSLFSLEDFFCTFSQLLASTLNYPNSLHSKEHSHPIPAPLSSCFVKPTVSTTSLPNLSNFPHLLTPSKWWNIQAKTPNHSASQAPQPSSGVPPQLQRTPPAPHLAARAAHHVCNLHNPVAA